MAGEEPSRVLLGEVFPLHEHAGAAVLQHVDQLVDQLVVLLVAGTSAARSEIERIRQQRLVVRPDIDHDRQRRRRVDTAHGGVQRELADRDAHATDTEIAEPENALAVGDDDDPDVPVELGDGVVDELVDAAAVAERHVHPVLPSIGA